MLEEELTENQRRNELLAKVADRLHMQVLSGLQHLHDVLLRHLHLPPHHPGENQGQPLRRAGAPLHDGDWVVLIFVASGEQGQEELAVDCQDGLGDRVSTSILVHQGGVVMGQPVLQTNCKRFRKVLLHAQSVHY